MSNRSVAALESNEQIDRMPNVEPRQLRLYVARGTPNSVRAEQNLKLALAEAAGGFQPEVIDVLSNSRRAIKDGVIVTPTLIGHCGERRQIILGDLSDMKRLLLFLHNLLSA
jgi:hypothetical protein